MNMLCYRSSLPRDHADLLEHPASHQEFFCTYLPSSSSLTDKKYLAHAVSHRKAFRICKHADMDVRLSMSYEILKLVRELAAKTDKVIKIFLQGHRY